MSETSTTTKLRRRDRRMTGALQTRCATKAIPLADAEEGTVRRTAAAAIGSDGGTDAATATSGDNAAARVAFRNVNAGAVSANRSLNSRGGG
eukprot:CAMPEP_0197438474 /NCGR_PEP_ID=MMETSP1175-20131217/5471_1 /TAXON_ID=1003142 /ORGANISM="Triceratium dubium, Strain CCMP147" /LENGTH=91 /DNA_ID=CAMNT_0042968219 /DNA_START=247 /DNA_END=518 /DNA_ORIENTATION=-